MRIVDLRSPSANLIDAFEQLETAWNRLKETWDDSAMQAFEDNYMEPVRPRIRMTLDAASRLASVFDDAQRECSPKREQY
ncbi:MAG: hypothetical protein AB8G99_13630 [Planctomycetaceae bacterium]